MSPSRLFARLVFVYVALIVSPILHAQTYTVIDLGTLGGPAATPTAFNGSFLVGGSLTTVDDESLFRWRDSGTFAALPGPGGCTVAFGVNDKGVTVGLGFYADQTIEHAFLWKSGKPVDLGDLPKGYYSVAYGINSSNTVVGCSYLMPVNSYHAFVWKDGGIQDEGVFPDGNYSQFNAINDNGQAVGLADNLFDNAPQSAAWEHAVLWDSVNGLQDLGTLGGRNSAAWAINNAGQVVGSSDTASGEQHAFLWDAANGMIDLGVPAGYNASTAYSINASGQVTGETYKVATASFGGFVWDAVNGMRNIDSLIPTGSPKLFGVVNNDLGWLAAAAEDSAGEQHVYLLKP